MFFVGQGSEKSKDKEEKNESLTKSEAVWATINYAINTSQFKSRINEVEVGLMQKLEKPDRNRLSDINNRA